MDSKKSFEKFMNFEKYDFKKSSPILREKFTDLVINDIEKFTDFKKFINFKNSSPNLEKGPLIFKNIREFKKFIQLKKYIIFLKHISQFHKMIIDLGKRPSNIRKTFIDFFKSQIRKKNIDL